MNTLQSYYANRILPTADVERWLMLQKAPASFRDVYIAVAPYSDPQGEWELCESLVATSGFCESPEKNFFLSLLINTDATRPTEFDLGVGKFYRSNEPGTFVLGDDIAVPRIQGNGPFHSLALYFDREAMLSRLKENLDGDEPSLEFLHSRTFRDEGLEAMMKQLLYEGCQSQVESRLLREELIERILQRLLVVGKHDVPQVSERDRLKNQSVAKVLDYIHANLHLDISLEELSGVAGVTRSHFGRLFRQTVGIPPVQYIIRLRVEQTKQMLKKKSHELSIDEIGRTCGYYDRSHMHHEFVRHVGVTPDIFRRYS